MDKEKKSLDKSLPSTSSSPSLSTNRLMSFLGPRNLLLEGKGNIKLQRGAINKNVPKPNLNVQRNKRAE